MHKAQASSFIHKTWTVSQREKNLARADMPWPAIWFCSWGLSHLEVSTPCSLKMAKKKKESFLTARKGMTCTCPVYSKIHSMWDTSTGDNSLIITRQSMTDRQAETTHSNSQPFRLPAFIWASNSHTNPLHFFELTDPWNRGSFQAYGHETCSAYAMSLKYKNIQEGHWSQLET